MTIVYQPGKGKGKLSNCESCKGTYSVSTFSRYKCTYSSFKIDTIYTTEDITFAKVLSTMGDDTIGTYVKSSNVIKCIGKNLTMKNKNKIDKLQVAVKTVRQSMRQLGELFIEMDAKTVDTLDETSVYKTNIQAYERCNHNYQDK